jgi:hypothetical protein
MTRRIISALAFAGLAVLLPTSVFAAGAVQRFALVAAANDGGPDRPPLQYALSDADRFARVIVTLGGVAADDAIVLKQPKLKQLEEALDLLKSRVVRARAASNGGGRIELVLYYSGHADDKGLLLGEDRYSYRSLRDRLDEVPADVRIAVLDACASGAITRLKGGRRQQAFLVDESADMRGHAFLTSSAESEAAQESDRIQSSYFTHYLVSGLRGAADMSGEGKVTLNEAYQFAFTETLGRTVETKGGAQHPSYDINLSGTGEVVMTDLRQTSATLVLGAELDGRFFVRNAKRELVVELYKPIGRKVELGVEPGSYEVHLEREAAAFLAKPKLDEGSQVVLEPAQFTPTTPEPTRPRGGVGPPPFAVSGRNRVELRIGVLRMLGDAAPVNGVIYGADNTDPAIGLQYTRYLREDLALTLAVNEFPMDHGTELGPAGAFAGSRTVFAVPFGLRWIPAGGDLQARLLKPYLAAGLGPVFGESNGASSGPDGVFAGYRTHATVGGHLGAGVDIHLNRRWSFGLSVAYNWMVDFAEPVGKRDDYSGFDLRLSVGWLFGKGSAARD